MRFGDTDKYLPLDNNLPFGKYGGTELMMTGATALIIFNATMIMMIFMQVQPKYGLLVELVTQCIKDIGPFTFFLFIYIFMFAAMYRVLGSDMAASGWQGLQNHVLIYSLQTLQNGIGNISNPGSQFWVNEFKNQTISSKNKAELTMLNPAVANMKIGDKH